MINYALKKFISIFQNMLFTCYNCNMGPSGLPVMYTQSQRATCPRAEGVHIRQTISGHVIYGMDPPIGKHKELIKNN